jgi:NADH-quinone oxidoreductase subunit L
MTVPLIILAFFAITVGWLSVPNDFPVLGPILPNLGHDFVGATLAEHPEAVDFNIIPLLISVLVSLGGLTLGYLTYRQVKAGADDPLAKPLGRIWIWLKNKYYIDELYHLIFIRPATWLSEVFSIWMDMKVIDGILHGIASVGPWLGTVFRNYFDKPVVNGFGDWVGESIKKLGVVVKYVQTGKVQQYMIIALVSLAVFVALFYYLFAR